tara:strand:- start:2110 stop:2706 length:597 start_codon:yes stop_codon:yes gene_type:complete
MATTEEGGTGLGGYDAVDVGEAGTTDPATGQVIPEGEYGEMDSLAGAGKGAMKGAAAGAAFGPWGVLIGGVLGGVRGAFTAEAEADKFEDAQHKATVSAATEATGAATRASGVTTSSINEHAGGKVDLNQTANLQYGGVDPMTEKLMGPVLPNDQIAQQPGAIEKLGGVSVNERGFSSYSSGGTLDTSIPGDVPQNWG